MKKITAKFNSVCAATGRKIRKGEEMYYDYATKKCYTVGNQPEPAPQDPAAGMIQANEDAYFDNFCLYNNI